MRYALETSNDSDFKWLFEQSRIANQIKRKFVANIHLPTAFDLPAEADGVHRTKALEGIAQEVASAYKEPHFESATIPYRTKMLKIVREGSEFYLSTSDLRLEFKEKHTFRIIQSKKHGEYRRKLLESYLNEDIAKEIRSLTGRNGATKEWNEIAGKLVFRRKRGWEFHLSYEPILASEYEPKNILGIDLGLRKPIVAVVRSPENKSLRTLIVRPERRKLRKNHQEEYFRHLAQEVIIPLAKKFEALISLEDLNVNAMKEKTSRLPKEEKQIHRMISQAAFKKLQKIIRESAQAKGVPTTLVDPRGTSQCCPRCNPDLNIYADYGKFYPDGSQGHAERVKCPSCSYENDADWIGAWNIAGRALKNYGFTTNTSASMRTEQCPPSRALEAIPSTAVAKVEVLSITQSATSETIEKCEPEIRSHL